MTKLSLVNLFLILLALVAGFQALVATHLATCKMPIVKKLG